MRALLLLLLFVSTGLHAQTRIEARVTDGSGTPVAYATVWVVGTADGAATDAQGRAVFSTSRRGAVTAGARFLGYDEARARVVLGADTVRVSLVLRERLVDLSAAVVSADAFASGADVRGLSPLDVVTTPGAAADLFQAIQSFPGLTAAADGAGLFVRGGDVSETAVLIDGARLLHPYQYESPQGGARSTLSPFLVRGTRFSTGGFSARYGDALSGVLALDSQNEPTSHAQTLDVGLAGAALGADVPVGRGGVRLAATQTFTDALFWINGRGGDFETAPRATTASAIVAVPLRGAGRVKGVAMANADRVGVRTGEAVYRGRSQDALALVQWTDLQSGWAVSATASHAARSSEQSLGALQLSPASSTTALRLATERPVARRLILNVGAEADRRKAIARGEAPAGAETISFDVATRGTRAGVWAEAEAQPSRRLVVVAGLRADRHTALRATALDPRLSALVALTPHTRLRIATGRYSQAPDLSLIALDSDERLGVQQARHLVAGVLHERGPLTLRAEVYAKTYRRLALHRGPAVYGGDGTGRSHGLDLFARFASVEATRFSGWVAYSLLDAHRTLIVRDGLGIRAERGRPTFGVAHSVNVVGKARLGRRLVVAGRLRAAAGRPATAVQSTVVQGGVAYPIDGPPGAETLPAFARLDASVSYTLPLGRAGTVVLYGAIDNLFNRRNATGYDDSAARRLLFYPYRRSVYAGLTFLFS